MPSSLPFPYILQVCSTQQKDSRALSLVPLGSRMDRYWCGVLFVCFCVLFRCCFFFFPAGEAKSRCIYALSLYSQSHGTKFIGERKSRGSTEKARRANRLLLKSQRGFRGSKANTENFLPLSSHPPAPGRVLEDPPLVFSRQTATFRKAPLKTGRDEDFHSHALKYQLLFWCL